MNPYSSIETIQTYLNRIHGRFLDFLKEGHDLCFLRKLDFSGGHSPSNESYSNVNFQQYYILRYGCANAFWYQQMFRSLYSKKRSSAFQFNTILNDSFREDSEGKTIDTGKIKVISIGCGAMFDYWAMASDFDRKKLKVPFFYEGIDPAAWDSSVRISPRPLDQVRFHQADAVQFLEGKPELDANIFFFPQSIGEFSNQAFQKLCGVFTDKPIPHDQFHVLISIRENEVSKKVDLERAQKLKEAIQQNGFEAYSSGGHLKVESKIADLDPKFRIPPEIIGTLKKVYEYCDCFEPDGESCRRFGDAELCIDSLSRYPILSAKYVHYIVMTFKRKTE